MATKYITEATSIKYAATSGMDAPVPALNCVLSTTANEVATLPIEAPITTALTLDLSAWDTITNIAIHNEDPTNYIRARVRTSKSTKTFATNKLGFTATVPNTITDDDSTFISALDAKAGDYAVITGTTEVANTGTFLIQAVAAGTLTMAETTAFTLDADDVATPTIEIQCDVDVRVSPGACVNLGPVVPGSDLSLLANTAACACTIFIRGT